jgi:hypothetical protein
MKLVVIDAKGQLSGHVCFPPGTEDMSYSHNMCVNSSTRVNTIRIYFKFKQFPLCESMILACRFDCQVTGYRTSNEPAYFKEGQFYVTVHWGGKPMRNRVNDIIDTHTPPAPRRKRYARGVILICAKKHLGDRFHFIFRRFQHVLSLNPHGVQIIILVPHDSAKVGSRQLFRWSDTGDRESHQKI